MAKEQKQMQKQEKNLKLFNYSIFLKSFYYFFYKNFSYKFYIKNINLNNFNFFNKNFNISINYMNLIAFDPLQTIRFSSIKKNNFFLIRFLSKKKNFLLYKKYFFYTKKISRRKFIKKKFLLDYKIYYNNYFSQFNWTNNKDINFKVLNKKVNNKNLQIFKDFYLVSLVTKFNYFFLYKKSSLIKNNIIFKRYFNEQIKFTSKWSLKLILPLIYYYRLNFLKRTYNKINLNFLFNLKLNLKELQNELVIIKSKKTPKKNSNEVLWKKVKEVNLGEIYWFSNKFHNNSLVSYFLKFFKILLKKYFYSYYIKNRDKFKIKDIIGAISLNYIKQPKIASRRVLYLYIKVKRRSIFFTFTSSTGEVRYVFSSNEIKRERVRRDTTGMMYHVAWKLVQKLLSRITKDKKDYKKLFNKKNHKYLFNKYKSNLLIQFRARKIRNCYLTNFPYSEDDKLITYFTNTLGSKNFFVKNVIDITPTPHHKKKVSKRKR